MKKYQALIFDMDGVVIDSEPMHEKAARIVVERYGVEIASSLFAQFKGKTARNFYDHLTQIHGESLPPAPMLLEEKQVVYRALFDELQPIPGVLSFIQRAHATFEKLGLTTSASRKNQQLAFARFDLHPYFDAVVTADDIRQHKPHPEPYLTTAKKLQTPPSACMVIEDAPHGIHAARAAGCTVAGLTSSFPASTLAAAGAHLVIETYDDLARHLGWT